MAGYGNRIEREVKERRERESGREGRREREGEREREERGVEGSKHRLRHVDQPARHHQPASHHGRLRVPPPARPRSAHRHRPGPLPRPAVEPPHVPVEHRAAAAGAGAGAGVDVGHPAEEEGLPAGPAHRHRHAAATARADGGRDAGPGVGRDIEPPEVVERLRPPPAGGARAAPDEGAAAGRVGPHGEAAARARGRGGGGSLGLGEVDGAGEPLAVGQVEDVEVREVLVGGQACSGFVTRRVRTVPESGAQSVCVLDAGDSPICGVRDVERGDVSKAGSMTKV